MKLGFSVLTVFVRIVEVIIVATIILTIINFFASFYLSEAIQKKGVSISINK